MPITPLLNWTTLVSDPRDKSDRHFNGPVWKLSDIQQHVKVTGRDGILIVTTKAASDMNNELRWNMNDLCGFITTLGAHRYIGSQMCFSSPASQKAHPADAYLMGYSHVTKMEWQQQIPPTYLKFSFNTSAEKLLVFSIHPEKDKKNR